jgi:transposase-like protein
MSKVRPPYPAEFRQQMVVLVRAGRSPAELSREFNATAQSITNCAGERRLGPGYLLSSYPPSKREQDKSRKQSPRARPLSMARAQAPTLLVQRSRSAGAIPKRARTSNSRTSAAKSPNFIAEIGASARAMSGADISTASAANRRTFSA